MTDDRMIPMPPDFRRVVQHHRDRVYRHAANTPCPTCQATPGDPCTTVSAPTAKHPAHTIQPDPNGLHTTRYDFGQAVVLPIDRQRRTP